MKTELTQIRFDIWLLEYKLYMITNGIEMQIDITTEQAKSILSQYESANKSKADFESDFARNKRYGYFILIPTIKN